MSLTAAHLRRCLALTLVAVVTIGLGTPARAVTPDLTGDITSPELVSLSIDPTSVDLTVSDAQVTVTAHLTDAGTGVIGGRLDVSAPNGGQYPANFALISGSTHDGVWAATTTLPAGAPGGEWSIWIQAHDAADNFLHLSRSDLEARGLRGHIDVRSDAPDTEAPQLRELQLDPRTVDVRAGAASVAVRVRVTDVGVGSTTPSIWPVGPNPTPGGVDPPSLSLVEGTVHDGWWQGSLHVRRYSHAGTWHLNVDLTDKAGNRRRLDESALTTLGLTGALDVLSEQDIQPPTFIDAQISTVAVDVSQSDQEVHFKATVRDNLSGVDDNGFGLHGVHLSLYHPIQQFSNDPAGATRVSGTALDGTYQLSTIIPKSSATGLWEIRLRTMDVIRNHGHVMGATDLAVLGLPEAILVYNTPLPPLDVTVEPADAAAVVRWAQPADDRGAAITEYVVRETTSGQTVRVSGSARETVFHGLANDQQHSFTVLAVNRAGDSDPSAPASATPSATLPPAKESTSPSPSPSPTPTPSPTDAGPAEPEPVVEPVAFQRLAGQDRIETAIAVSRASHPAGDAAAAVVLARADGFADALAGTPLAAQRNAPLLLTGSRALDARVAAEIDRVLTAGSTVHLLGGQAALSADVEAAVLRRGYRVVRYAGSNRFSTAVQIAERGLGAPSVILQVDGHGFADALAAGTAAAVRSGAVLLTDGLVQSPDTARYLSAHNISDRYAVGGAAAAADPYATAIAGADRYATAVRVAERFFPAPAAVAISNGTNYPDALAGGAAAARAGAPLLLVAAQQLPLAVGSYLQGRGDDIQRGLVLGGPVAVSDTVVRDAEAAVMRR